MSGRIVGDEDFDRVSSRLLGFVFDLFRAAGEDPVAFANTLPTIGPAPGPWVTWDDYIAMIERLGEVAGGAEGVAKLMRAVLPSAYADLRALTSFFPGTIPFFQFVTHHLNRSLVPSAVGVVTMSSPTDVTVKYELSDQLVGSQLYLAGTVTLIELFPTHFSLPEGTVTIVELSERSAEFRAEFPAGQPKFVWGTSLVPPTIPDLPTNLTQREQEVLRLVCNGLTNPQIGAVLGTAPSTVKSQISSILAKMDVANRTELAALVSRRS